MGIFSKKSNANKYAERGYERAEQSLNPYTQHAGEDFDYGRNTLHGMMSKYGQLPDYHKKFYDYMNQSPVDMLNSVMSQYEQSPMAQYQQKFAQSAMDNKMNAQGMGGSANQELLDAEIGNIIGSQDMQQFLKNVLGSFDVQHEIFGDYNKQGASLAKMFQQMLGTEYGASKELAGNAMRTGQIEANSADRNAANHQRGMNNMLHALMRIPGDAYFLHELFKKPGAKAAGTAAMGALL